MDERTFTQKVLGCERKLYRISRTLLPRDEDCRDAVQEALVKAWRCRGALRDERYFDTWLVRIVINECRTLHRKNRLKLVPVEQAENAPDPRAAIPDPPDGRALAALHALPEKQRIATELAYIEGMSIAEIAAILRVPTGTVKWRLHQGRAQLRRTLEEEEFFNEEG